MADDNSRDYDDQSAKRQSDQLSEGPSADYGAQAAESAPQYPSSLLGNAQLGARGNAPVRSAVVTQAQRAYGNRAVQRYLQRSSSGAATTAPNEDLGDRIRSKSGGGSSLEGGVQSTLEDGIGADMSGVRVHNDPEANNMARSVDAVAFTTGSDIFFREGMYNPGSSDGMRLLAHEATHTVQQSQGPVSGTPAPGGVSISDPSDSFEQAAEQSANNVMSGTQANAQLKPASGSAQAVQRAGEEEELQTMRTSSYTATVQRAGKPEEEELQTMRTDAYVQREAEEEEMPT